MASGFFNDRQTHADRQLSLNGRVEVRWLRDGFSYRGQGQIVALSRHEATVTLSAAVHSEQHRFPVGSRIQVPRYQDQTRWSDDTCVIPL